MSYSNLKLKFFLITVFISLAVFSLTLLSHNFMSSSVNKLLFSNTETWNEDVYKYSETNLSELSTTSLHAITEIKLSPPPKNSSKETEGELEELHRLVIERTSEKISQIDRELIYTGLYFHDFNLTEEIHPTKPRTQELLLHARYELLPVLVHFKNKFNRVRPYVLDPTLTKVIEAPGHPAYPSGHSTEAHLYALILGELNPVNKEIYWKDASRIARNREIAGVHYQSDTEAGVMLAQDFFEILRQDPTYQELFPLARAEWTQEQ